MPQYMQLTSCSPGRGAGRGAAVVKNVYAFAALRACAGLSMACSSVLMLSTCPSFAAIPTLLGTLASPEATSALASPLGGSPLLSASCAASVGFTSTAAGDVLLCARAGAAF